MAGTEVRRQMIYLPKIDGGFPVIYADPPWSYKTFSRKGDSRSASRHYNTMTIEQICDMPVAARAAKDCHLFMWATGPNLAQAFRVLDAWGFKYSSVGFTWVKLNKKAGHLFYDRNSFFVGMGHTTRKNAEFCLLGRRGKPVRNAKNIRELIVSPVRQHSQKPDETYERIERYATGPYLELFSRTDRPGWTAWGDQTGTLNQT